MKNGLLSNHHQWPGELEGLLLRAALLDGEEAEQAWRSWKERGGDVDTVQGDSFRLLPLAYRNLARIGADEPELPRLKGVYRYWWASNQRLFDRMADALEVLHAAGLETIVLKGAALTALHYRDSGARPMEDGDILVRTRSGQAALDALRAAGWTPRKPGVDRLLRVRHSTPLMGPRGNDVDLHWRMLYEPAQDDDIWEAAVPLQLGRESTLGLSPTDQLLHVCAHGLVNWPPPLRWVADAVTVTRTAGSGIDWDRLAERSMARRVTLSVAAALEWLREAFAIDVPEAVLSQLRAARTTPTERLARRLALSPPRRGGYFVELWDNYRRLRTVPNDSQVPASYFEFLADFWDLENPREVGPRLARKAFQIARYGSSHPTGGRR